MNNNENNSYRRNYFSIVIPLYNKENFILSTINSVLNQTYKYFEIIIINDGSTDNSLSKLNCLHDDRIKIINKENGGVSESRNIGIQEAKYDWIAFLDADDFWDENYLQEANRMINTYPKADIIGTNYNCIIFPNYKQYSKEGYISNYFEINLKEYLFSSSSVIVQKKCFQNIKFKNYLKNGEDIEMWYQLAKHYKIAYNPSILSFYRKEVSTESKRIRNISVENDWSYYIDFKNCNNDPYEKRYLYKIVASSSISLFRNNNYASLLRLIKKHGLFNIYRSIVEVIIKKI